MSIQDSEHNIALAVKSLEKGIGRIQQKSGLDPQSQSQSQRQRQIHRLVQHIKHLLTQLCTKRQSLQALIEWFRQEWDRLEAQLADHTLEILEHSLPLFVRCQDGLVLLTSGECRHPGDLDEAKSTSFPSKLSTLKEREDGYTSLYKANAVYSGFGWDEYANETVGIQARLVAILKRYHKHPWDHLERYESTNLLETLLDQQEQGVKNLQHELQRLKEKMKQDITKRLRPTKLSFVTQDKMERLLVKWKDQTICLERRANTFQIQGSVLPSEYKKAKDWENLALTLIVDKATKEDKVTNDNSKRKRRLVIEDSDSEQEENPPNSKRNTTCPPKEKPVDKASGIMIRVETSKPKSETESSLNAIKAQMGVDIQGLEASREELEQETGKDQSYEEDNVKRLRNVLQRAQSRQPADPYEVWDARECLRLAYMELGNDYLWSSKKFEKAFDCFKEAKSLVLEQQASHRISVESANDVTDQSRYIERDLLHRRAEATVNIGVVLVEWSEKEKIVARKKNIHEAISEFRQVRKLVEDIRQQSRADQEKHREHSTSWAEAMADIFKADKLESLACSWMHQALSIACQEKQAIEVLEYAAGLFRGAKSVSRVDLLQPALESALESLEATSKMTNLACTSLERLGRTDRQKGEVFLDIASRALSRNVEISQEIEHLVSVEAFSTAVQSFQRENNIGTPKDAFNHLNAIKKWWESVKREPTDFALNDPPPRRLPRPELFPDGSGGKFPEPTARILLSAGHGGFKQVQNRRIERTSASSECQGAAHALQAFESNESLRPKTYRKWGDELIPQELDPERPGTTRPKLAYPSVAPTLPPEIMRALFDC